NNSIDTSVDVSPTVGLGFRPWSWLRFGAVAHAPEQFVIDTNVTATLPSGTQSGSQRHDVYDWMPWSLGLGLHADLLPALNDTLSLAASAHYSFWSAYRDRHGISPRDYGADLAWKDTLKGAIGVRYAHGVIRGFLDFTYVPSPVPEQKGRSNYVDNDRVGMLL